MVKITGDYKDSLTCEQLKTFYEAAGWISYTADIMKLQRAVQQSLYVVTAWIEDKLVGLVRVVGDGETILFVQDVIVLKAYRRCGIAMDMVDHLIEKFPDVRQKVLLTEESDETRGFFEEVGFMSCDQGDLVGFVRFD